MQSALSLEDRQALARTSPAGLAVATSNSKWQLAKHLDLIDKAIVDAVAGRGPKRLVIAVPPRHGKSELISHRTPAWFLGVYPDRQVMLASYESSFAQTWSRKARDLLEEHGQQLYGVGVRTDARAQDRWYIDGHDGVMGASGIGGRFTGMGADLLIVDDPLKNAEEARSQTIRDKHIDWWQSTAVTRLHPDAVVIVLMTRWHQDDLGGYLLTLDPDDAEGEPFTEIRLPALAEAQDVLGRAEGEALWPDRYTTDLLAKRRKSVGTYWWSAMYQGRPTPEGGGMFKRDWFPILDRKPVNPLDKIKWVRYWDLAATEETSKSSDPDHTVGCLLGKRPDNTFVLADIRRVRKSPGGVEREMRSTAEIDGKSVPIRIEQEPGSNAKIAVSHLIRNLFQGYDARAVVSSKSKIVRADPVSAQAEAGHISVVRGGWNMAFFDEAEQFPNGSHDDQVDGLSGAYAALMANAEVRVQQTKEQPGQETVVQSGDLTLRGERYVDTP